MNRDVYKFLEDIRLAIGIIGQHLKGIESLESYISDLKTIDSVERRLSVIGEALYKANKLEKSLPVSDKTKIIGLRHIIVHEYNLINHETVWEIIPTNLPILN
jgi:uncharacterized protein with HEPN domain